MRHVRRSLAALLVCACCFGLLATGCKKKKDKPYIPPWSETAEVVADKDAWVDEFAPDANYGSATSLAAGYQNDYEQWTYLYFDLLSVSVPIAADIVSAELWLYISETDNLVGGQFKFYLEDTSADWDEATITGNNAPSGTAVGTVAGPADRYTGWWKITSPALTALVQKWADNSFDNHGVAIGPEWWVATSVDDRVVIESWENISGNAPKLKVYYNP